VKIDIAGLKIDNLGKQELLAQIFDRLKNNQKTFVITPYSEFLYHSIKNPKLLEIFNQADFSIPDGIGIFWAHKFLQIPLTATSYYGKILQAWWQAKISLLSVLFGSRKDGDLKEKIPGSEFVWDLADLAAKNNWSIYLLGGFGDTPERVAHKLISTSAGQLRIAGYSSKNPDDPSVIENIQNANPDMVFVAYGPIKQEAWIVQNMHKVPARLFIGLGGTFDYIAGKQPAPPPFLRSIGLEWLWRLITQPRRFGRIWNATVGLMRLLICYKIHIRLPYRKNVVIVILNNKNEIFVGHRKPNSDATDLNFWQFPQGGVEEGEDIITGAKREAEEEVGITSLEYLKTSPSLNRYLWRVGFSNYFKGQEQTLVYFKFIGSDLEIDFNKFHTPEFTEYKWVSISKLNNTLHPLRQSLGTIVQEDLKDLA